MDHFARLLTDHWIIACGALALAAVWRGGCLSPRSLDGVPRREAGLDIPDLFVGLFIYLAGNFLLRSVLQGLGLMSPPGSEAAPALTVNQKVAIALISQGLTQLPVVLYLLLRTSGRGNGWRELGVRPRRPAPEVLAGLLGVVVAVPIVLALADLIVLVSTSLGAQEPERLGHDLLRALQTSESALATVGLVVSAGVIAPLLEEGIFRGLVQTVLLEIFGRRHRAAAIALAALLFSIIHLGLPWQVLPGLFVLGVILGWLYERTGSLLPGVVVHMGFNAVNMALVMTGLVTQ